MSITKKAILGLADDVDGMIEAAKKLSIDLRKVDKKDGKSQPQELKES